MLTLLLTSRPIVHKMNNPSSLYVQYPAQVQERFTHLSKILMTPPYMTLMLSLQ